MAAFLTVAVRCFCISMTSPRLAFPLATIAELAPSHAEAPRWHSMDCLMPVPISSTELLCAVAHKPIGKAGVF